MFKSKEDNLSDFIEARYGMLIHFGLYSLIGRGEWCLNRELMDIAWYKQLAARFTADKFDADKLCAFAKSVGMRYICFPTMHHDGFMLYDSALSDFTTVKTVCGRDLVAETITAARKHGLRVHLYHSLNNWISMPDAVDALERKEDYVRFIDNTFDRVRELVTLYNPIDVLWYDGWWPFNASQWQAARMNDMVNSIQPWLVLNGRNGLAGDFATPEGHMSAPIPWRPWEACLPLNESWCYIKGDEYWKSPFHLIGMLLTAAKGNGNLMLGVGLEPDGGIPSGCARVMREVGDWLGKNGSAIYGTEVFDMGLMERGSHRSDWGHVCDFTASGENLYLTVKFWPGEELIITGLKSRPVCVTMLADGNVYPFLYDSTNGKLVIRQLPKISPGLRPVFCVKCDSYPEIYRCGGMRTPLMKHPPYDPCQSDIIL